MYQDVPFWVPLFQLKGREAAKEMWLIRQRQMGTSEPILLDPVFATASYTTCDVAAN